MHDQFLNESFGLDHVRRAIAADRTITTSRGRIPVAFAGILTASSPDAAPLTARTCRLLNMCHIAEIKEL